MWSADERNLLTAILDVLIPPNAARAIPGGGALGVADFLGAVAKQDAQFRTQITALLNMAQAATDGVSAELVRQLEAEHPDAFTALLTETYKGYYSRPDMRAKFGVGAHPVHPLGYDVPPESPELMETLTAPGARTGAHFPRPHRRRKMSHESVDVLIIGAGASGAALAWSLLETRMRILCLEQGDHLADKDFPSRRDDYELARYGAFSADPNIRQARQDYPINVKESCIAPVNWCGVGGSTMNFLGHWPRLRPSDFRTKTLDGVGADWPLDYHTLAPFYDMNDRNIGASGLGGNPAYPDYTPPHPPIPIGILGQTLAKGFNALGWHWWPSDVAILSQDDDGRQKCVNAGTCDLGCAAGAKGGANFTYWPMLENAGVELRTNARVREILVDEASGFATGALYHDLDGQLHEQKAALVVMACNGIGTPRILLNSKSKSFPDGLANHSGLVGKNLMFHPLTGVAGGV